MAVVLDRAVLLALCCSLPVTSWNSAGTVSRFYSFQEFYTDAQYGPDFGYYSTGRILHADGPRDDGLPGSEGSQDWFNSYTTLPMSLSPFFGQLLADRVVGMWASMGRPQPVFIVEFGGGTGMLARDILRHCRHLHPDFFEALTQYVIGERSPALQRAQQRTAAEFRMSGKLEIVDADARKASQVRHVLEKQTQGAPIHGFLLSNELLDEFDPVRLRLVWKAGHPPDAQGCLSCAAFREAYVLHRVDDAALVALLKRGGGTADSDMEAGKADDLLDVFRWEGKVFTCGLLDTPPLRRLASEIADRTFPHNCRGCAPLQISCVSLLLAVEEVLQREFAALPTTGPPHRWRDAIEKVHERYLHHLSRTNGTVPLTKERYRDLRRRAAQLGQDVELAFLAGGDALPGRVHSEEIFLGLSSSRCRELQGWRERNMQRLSAAAALRDQVAPLYDRLGGEGEAEHLKLVVRPGEAEFVREAALLIDEGFMLTLDYGADAEALLWQSMLHPNFDGIHTMDARAEFAEQCTQVSYLACPGLQDLTSSVDFTEVADAGRRLGGWEVALYGPLFLLELAADPWLNPAPTMHLIDRAGGARTVGLHSWYRKAEGEPWASFKALVQRRGGEGSSWSLGGEGLSWKLLGQKHLGEAPSPCWAQDIAKPALAAQVTAQAASAGGHDSDIADLHAAFSDLLSSGALAGMDDEYSKQKQAYRDLHLGIMLADYWLHLSHSSNPSDCLAPDSATLSERVDGVRSFAAARRLPELHGSAMFDRVLDGLVESVFGNETELSSGMEPFACAAAAVIQHGCRTLTSKESGLGPPQSVV